MVPFLITLAFIGVLIVTGTMVNAHLYDAGALGGRSQRHKSAVNRSKSREAMTDEEYFTLLDKIDEDGPRYARHSLLMLSILVILIGIVVISLLSGPIH